MGIIQYVLAMRSLQDRLRFRADVDLRFDMHQDIQAYIGRNHHQATNR